MFEAGFAYILSKSLMNTRTKNSKDVKFLEFYLLPITSSLFTKKSSEFRGNK